MVTTERDPYVLVGYDGSAESELALRWAVEEARLRRRPLTVCHVWSWPYPEIPNDETAVDIVRRMAEHILDRGVMAAYDQAPGLTVHKRLVTGNPRAVLLNEARNAELVVLGSHGSGGFSGLAAGSAALQVPAYANCPVVVHRPVETVLPRVVVGVDGSSSAEAALAFAFEEAVLRGWEVEAVYGCWEMPAVAETDLALYADAEMLKRSAGARLERAVAPWREKYPQVPAWTALRMTDSRKALLEAAERAGLLAVGDRGQGGVSGMRLGAVTQTMLQHAPCPVAVVHPTRRDQA